MFDLLKQNGGKSAKSVFLLLRRQEMYLLDVPINHFCIRCSVFENVDPSVADYKQAVRGGVLQVMF